MNQSVQAMALVLHLNSDRFAAPYSALFHHIDHVADFTRCKVDLDEMGTRILQEYLQGESKRPEPFLQETFDSYAGLCEQFPELDKSVDSARPNIANCMRLIVRMKRSMMPAEDFSNSVSVSMDAMANWRNRLKDGHNLLVEARALWIADSLGLDGFTTPNRTIFPNEFSGIGRCHETPVTSGSLAQTGVVSLKLITRSGHIARFQSGVSDRSSEANAGSQFRS